MKREINPSETSRAQAFNYWMKSPMPMVTITKTFVVTKIYKLSKQKAAQSCSNILDEGAAIVGTSAVTGIELDCIVNQYSGIYNNPFLSWGRYRKHWFKVTLPISFQFHHV